MKCPRFMGSSMFLLDLLRGHEPGRVGARGSSRSVTVGRCGAIGCPVGRVVPKADNCAVWRASALGSVHPVGEVCPFKDAFGRGLPLQ
jgi:hypothetical protein